MNDAEALIAAAVAAPEDDLPRLVLADWYEEQGDSGRAAFIRAQVQLGQVKPWEPFAILCRHRQPDWQSGQPWQHTLPALPARGLEWHPTAPFRRGLPWSLIVRDLTAFLEHASALFDSFPIGQLHLPTGTLDQWRTFARGSWLNRVRSIHFYGTTTPIEPMAAICGSPGSVGIEEIVFEVASRPGMPEVLRRVFDAPLSEQLNSLGLLAIGAANSEELVDTLHQAKPCLKQLELSMFPATERNVRVLADSVAYRNIHQFTMRDSPTSQQELSVLYAATLRSPLKSFHIPGCAVRQLHSFYPSYCYPFNPHRFHTGDPTGPFPSSTVFAAPTDDGSCEWESVDFAGNQLGDDGFHGLSMISRNHLHEIDLRNNGITEAGAQTILDGAHNWFPVILRLDGNPIPKRMIRKLQDRFGDTLTFSRGWWF